MKRWSVLLVMILFGSVYGHAQFGINFGWNKPFCESCHWMGKAIRMTSRQAVEYHKIIHKYGEKIEREARKHHRYWDKAAEKIYKLRAERDRQLQRVLSPSQYNLYVRYVRETPARIHDWKGWNKNHYRNPKRHPKSPNHAYKGKPQKGEKYDKDKRHSNPGKDREDKRDNKDRKSNNRSSKEHTNRR